MTLRYGIPVTTVPRTLLDLAAVVPRDDLARAVERAEGLRLADPLSLDALLSRYPGRAGTRALRAVVQHGIEPILTRSELERLFLSALDARSLPRPEVNVAMRIGERQIEADFVWRAHALIVEVDGREGHHTIAAFERDRARDRALLVQGWRIVRITWRQLEEDAAAVAADLAVLLSPAPSPAAAPARTARSKSSSDRARRSGR